MEELYTALRNADAAGDTVAAQRLADYIRSQSGSAPAKPAAPGPEVEVPGVAETMLIGAGRGADQVVRGVKQLYHRATGNQPALAALKTESEENDSIYGRLTQARPVATQIGEVLPGVAALAGGVGLPAIMARGIVAGSVPGALKYGEDGERAARALYGGLGGAAGGAVGVAAGRLLQPVMSNVASRAAPEALQAAERLGYQPTAAQITQNPALANVESFFMRQPGSSGLMQRAATANQTALNTAGARAMGEQATDLSERTFATAQNRLGNEFQRLQDVTSPVLGDDFITAIARLDSKNQAKGAFANKNVTSLVNQSLDLAEQGKLTGEAYKQIHTELTNSAQSAFRNGDATGGQAFKSVREALDDAAKASLSKEDQAAWDTARRQWGAFKTMSKSNVAEAGNVSAPRMAAELRRGGPALRTGAAQGELADIARIGEQFKGALNPNSGNQASTLAYQNLMGPAMMLGNRLGAGAYMTAPAQRYFTNGLVNLGESGHALLGRTGALLGGPAATGLLGVE